VIWPNCVFSSRLLTFLHGGGGFFLGGGRLLSSRSEQFKNNEKVLDGLMEATFVLVM